MKLTWFGGTTIRIHIGGAMVVGDADQAPAGVDRTELLSGADRQFSLAGDALTVLEPGAWKPRAVARAIDATPVQPTQLFAIGHHAVLVDAAGEPPVVLMGDKCPDRPGRWSADAVIVAFAVGDIASVLEVFRPRLIALAAPQADVERAFAALRDRLDGTGLVALEPGLALEV